MLLHLVPRLFLSPGDPQCELMDLKIQELGILLHSGVDLALRQPYPNNCYQVVCRKAGRKAINGILVDTLLPLREFTLVTRWKTGDGRILRHLVNYVILDDEHDAISDDMTLWYGYSGALGGWKSRWPEVAKGWTPAQAQPRMDVVQRPRQGIVDDRILGTFIIERRETFHVHTLERERILSTDRAYSMGRRMPPINDVFTVAA